MLDFPRWKVWTIFLIIALGVLFAVPSLMPPDLKLPGFLPKSRISLGLDLAGGKAARASAFRKR